MKRQAHKLSGVVSPAIVLAVVFLFGAGRADGQVYVWGDNSYGQTNVPANATNVIALAAGDYHCLALRTDGTVVAWGANGVGQTNVPSDLTNAVSIAAGSTHSLALRSDGTIAMWGQIYGSGVTTVPSSATNVVALALGPGAQHALVLRADGSVVDWGNAGHGLTNIPPTAKDIVDVAAGSYYAVALRSDGKVVTWGSAPSQLPSDAKSATNIVAIASGWYGIAALRNDGTILVWGGGLSTPPPSAGFTNVVDLACPFNSFYSSSVLALRRNGTLVQYQGTSLPSYASTNIAAIAAGSYDAFALGGSGAPVFPGIPVNRTVPSGARAYFRMTAAGALPLSYQWSCNGTNIPGATNSVLTLTNVQPSLAGTCYSLTASNAFGMATNGPVTLNEVPLETFVQPTSISTVVGATVTFTNSTIGQGPFSYQWQFNSTNLLAGTNSTLTWTNAGLTDAGMYSLVASNIFGVVTSSVSLNVAPTIITSLPQNQTIFPGGTTTLSIGLQALIPVSYQWQLNGVNLDGATNNSLTFTNINYNQGGTYSIIFSDEFETVTNTFGFSVAPVAAWGYMGQSSVSTDLTNLIAIACGGDHSLVLSADGTVSGWGNDDYGQATAPAGLSNVISIAAGDYDSIALKSDGTVTAWGYNYFGETNVPADLTNVVAISAGMYNTLALKSDGTVVAWGDNTYGQTNVPPGLTNVVAISANDGSSMALNQDGTVTAWGYNQDGETNVPVGLSNVVAIAAGVFHSVALRADGTVVAWGDNTYGQTNVPLNLTNAAAIAAGTSHILALRTDGTVVVWGYPYSGVTNVPVGLINVAAISAKDYNNLALLGNAPPTLQAPMSNPAWTPGGFSVSLPTQSGRVYRLEYKTSLTDSNWTALPLAAGNGGALTLTDPTATNLQRFYRVRWW
jgi:alpha-tubulin suppressor-like RCC1 family protein